MTAPSKPAAPRAQLRPSAARAPAPGPAADALAALSRAARSVLLYDPGNATVEAHLAEFQGRMRAALEALGELVVEVAPFELRVGGEVVYAEADREKSLAFRLFRDGVRGIRVSAAAPPDELLGLLEIIAVRYTAVRQQEEDAVTLLRKAEFRGIAIDFVEGFTPAEEVPEPAFDPGVERAARRAPPPTWDTPLQQLPQPRPVTYRAVPEAALARLRGLDSDEAVVELAVSTATDLLRAAVREGWHVRDRDLSAFLDDLRDGLLVEGRLGALRAIADVMAECGATALRERLLGALAGAHAIELVLSSLPPGARDLDADAAAFAPLLGREALLDALVGAGAEREQRLLWQLFRARLPADAAALVERLPALAPGLVPEIVETVAARAPEHAAALGQRLLGRSEEPLRLAGLRLLAGAPAPVPLRAICALLADESTAIRIEAAEVLARRGDERVAEALRAAIDARGELEDDEVEALGRALAQAAPRHAAPLFAEWLRPRRRLIGGITAQQRARQWAAISGTGALPGADAEATLQSLADGGDPEVRRRSLRALARRRGREPRGR